MFFKGSMSNSVGEAKLVTNELYVKEEMNLPFFMQ